jgi:hypothetical protein
VRHLEIECSTVWVCANVHSPGKRTHISTKFPKRSTIKKRSRTSHWSNPMPSFSRDHPIIANSGYCANTELPGEGLRKINHRKGTFLIRFSLKALYPAGLKTPWKDKESPYQLEPYIGFWSRYLVMIFLVIILCVEDHSFLHRYWIIYNRENCK